MIICPIAIVASCKKCPAFKVCPLKELLGDYKPNETKEEKASQSEDASETQNQ